MTQTPPIPVFDGHNDVLLRLYEMQKHDAPSRFLEGTPDGHLDLPRARAGGMVGGLFAIFPADLATLGKALAGLGHVPEPLDPDIALTSTTAMAALLLRIVRQSAGAVSLCRSAAEIRAAIARGSLATVFHIEGVEAIGADLDMLHVLHGAGLRSLGPVWSRANIFGHGVPFLFPASPDTGPGLTEAGRDLVRECNALNVMIDLSHITEQGFRDVAALSTAPLVASHSNVHRLCASARNLTDWQLGAIRESGGLVGLNYATGFLREDGKMRADTGLDVMVRHVAALVEALGEDGVGLGSDFDGALIPSVIGDVTGVPRLLGALLEAGFGEALVRKIAADNWIGLLERTIG